MVTTANMQQMRALPSLLFRFSIIFLPFNLRPQQTQASTAVKVQHQKKHARGSCYISVYPANTVVVAIVELLKMDPSIWAVITSKHNTSR